MKIPQFDLPGQETVFNLRVETTGDGERLAKEQAAREHAAREAEAKEKREQLTLI